MPPMVKYQIATQRSIALFTPIYIPITARGEINLEINIDRDRNKNRYNRYIKISYLTRKFLTNK